jgi:4-diphosphocytidyl-2-C-methyl-D-erythritol kinase
MARRAMPIREPAPAKINLTLTVLGRRSDGYHELASLVTFASIADWLTLSPGAAARVLVSGPFASDIAGPNLVERALQLVAQRAPSLRLGEVALEKNLPVAAGLGGGSADAAAVLRALRRANPSAPDCRWPNIAAALGADVPACLFGRTAIVRGIGERLAPLAPPNRLPPLAAVLANPGVALATKRVFAALSAPARANETAMAALARGITGLSDVLELMRTCGNDLERPAIRLAPVIGEVKAELAALEGCRIAALSGSGATCFGLFDEHAAAERGAARLAARRPGWWVRAARLGDAASGENA